MKLTKDSPAVDVYAVGLLSDLAFFAHAPGRSESRRRLLHALRYPIRQARAGNWRAVRKYFNGYLAEHAYAGTRAGRGWTRRRAYRDLIRHLETGR